MHEKKLFCMGAPPALHGNQTAWHEGVGNGAWEFAHQVDGTESVLYGKAVLANVKLSPSIAKT
jgi:hypothetical protein